MPTKRSVVGFPLKALTLALALVLLATIAEGQARIMADSAAAGSELIQAAKKPRKPKPPPGDTTPPGAPLDLHLVEVEFGMATIAWTVPADDGHLVASGPVHGCAYYDPVRAEWHTFELCGVSYQNAGEWPEPGEEQACTLNYLEPDTDYLFRVRCVDDSDNWGEEAEVLVPTLPFSAFKDASWVIEEVPIRIDGILGHEFDADGNLVIGSLVGLWDQMGGGRWSTLPTVIRVITGVQDETEGTWSWTFEDIPGSAGSMRMDPSGRPAFEGGVVADLKKRTRDLVYTFHDGAGWRSEVVATGGHELSFTHGFAFDSEGNPVIAWCDDADGIQLARRSPTGDWSVEQVSDEVCEPYTRNAGLAFDELGNSAVTYRANVSEEFGAVRMTRWSGTSWVHETVCVGPDCAVQAAGASLVYVPQTADFSLAGDETWTWTMGCDRLGAEDWQCTEAEFGRLGEQSVFPWPAQAVWSGGRVLEVDSSGELLATATGKNGFSACLMRRGWGSSQWTTEYIDHPSTRGFPDLSDSVIGGPFLTLDPQGAPTLTWMWTWNYDSYSNPMYGLYFARKEMP